MIKLVKALFLSMLLIVSASAKDVDVDSLIAKAKSENKHIMIFFHIPGCPYCTRMLKENFKNEELLSEVKKNFIFEDMYTADDKEIKFKNFKGSVKKFSKHVKVFAYPSTLFMDDEGNTIHIAIGYRNIKEHLAAIYYISSKSYKKEDFETFKERWEFERDD
jgi:thioredoxin-related protein